MDQTDMDLQLLVNLIDIEKFQRQPFGPLQIFMSEDLKFLLDVDDLANVFVVHCGQDVAELRKIASKCDLNLPRIIIYNYDLPLITDAAKIPGYKDIPIPVMNTFLDYAKNYIGDDESIHKQRSNCDHIFQPIPDFEMEASSLVQENLLEVCNGISTGFGNTNTLNNDSSSKTEDIANSGNAKDLMSRNMSLINRETVSKQVFDGRSNSSQQAINLNCVNSHSADNFTVSGYEIDPIPLNRNMENTESTSKQSHSFAKSTKDCSSKFILNILLSPPDSKYFYNGSPDPPKGLFKSGIYIVDMVVHSFGDVTSDDNGAYINDGSPTNNFYYTGNDTIKAHRGDGFWFIKQRRGQKKYVDLKVNTEDVYHLCRTYRRHKTVTNFTSVICRVKSAYTGCFGRYMLVMNSLKEENISDESKLRTVADSSEKVASSPEAVAATAVHLPCHGNSTTKNKLDTPYIRSSPTLLKDLTNLLATGSTCKETYEKGIVQSGGPLNCPTQSLEPRDMRQIYNIRKNINNKSIDMSENKKNDEIASLLAAMKNDNDLFIRNIVLMKKGYLVPCFNDVQLNHIDKFCIDQNGVFLVDITFNLCDMWVTDTAYQNKRLVNSKGEHPWFLGPFILHMTKDVSVFSRLALELACALPSFKELQFLGTDLEKAIFQGFKSVAPDLKNLLCVKHMSDRDVKKLTELKARNSAKIIRDIYGKNDRITKELGLASSDDPEDFYVKLKSLKDSWEELAPGFHDWFSKYRASKFVESVIESARVDSGINGLFYNNPIESLHAMIKKDIQRKLTSESLIAHMRKVIERQHVEEMRAIYKMGEYRLSPEYKSLEVEHGLWNNWSDDRQAQHIKVFRNYQPTLSAFYRKPSNVGKKPNQATRKRNRAEAMIVEDRIDANERSQPVSPVVITKENGSYSCSKVTPSIDLNRLNPNRTTDDSKIYTLRLKSQHKAVTRCYSSGCSTPISKEDYLIVRSIGTVEYTDKNGVFKQKTGPVHFHFHEKCLKGNDSNFEYQGLIVQDDTKRLLHKDEIVYLKTLGINF